MRWSKKWTCENLGDLQMSGWQNKILQILKKSAFSQAWLLMGAFFFLGIWFLSSAHHFAAVWLTSLWALFNYSFDSLTPITSLLSERATANSVKLYPVAFYLLQFYLHPSHLQWTSSLSRPMPHTSFCRLNRYNCCSCFHYLIYFSLSVISYSLLS